MSRRDITPYNPDGPLLDQGYETSEEDADELALWKLGLGRRRVINRAGRGTAVKRWLHDLHSRTELDRSGNLPENLCSACGYLWKVDGSLHLVFGLYTDA